MVSAWRRLEPAPPPPPGRHLDRLVYGLMQPILGGRLLLRDRALLRAALVPVGWLAAFCAAWGLLHLGDGASEMVRHFYQTFAVLAPVPSVLLAAHYARMVVRARTCLGMPPADPRLQSVWRRCRHALAQVVLIAVAIAPATMLLDQIPLLGSTLVRLTAALWALHWIVVEAFDASRVNEPDAAADQRQPWFVVALSRAGDRVPLVGWVFRRLARFCDWLARPWREDIAVAEAHPLLMLGFGITTAALLATPVLNLFFRPIVLVGAIHVLVQLAVAGPPAERGPSSQAPTP
jgi:hypothetical protein